VCNGNTASGGGGDAALTDTVTLLLAEPPEPEQLRANVVVALSEPTDWEPLTALLPDQPFAAVQLVAFAEIHVSVELLPLVTEVGLALSDTVGAGDGAAVTVTVALFCTEPPDPVQDNAKVEVAENGPTESEPLVPFAPLQAPEAVQLIAAVELHVSVELLPLVTDVGLAARLSVGAGGGALPPPVPELVVATTEMPLTNGFCTAPVRLMLTVPSLTATCTVRV
jgi:hypothetical protein